MGRCHEWELLGLKEYLLARGPDRLGTFCSGSDSPVEAERAARQAFLRILKVDTDHAHVFSNEADSNKRRFITHVYPELKTLHERVEDMCGEKILNTLTGEYEDPVSCNRLAAGFPCTTASAYNSKWTSNENRSCCKKGTGQTGTVWKSIVDYLVSPNGREVSSIHLENVPPLARQPLHEGKPCGPSNADVCVDDLDRKADCVTTLTHLSGDWAATKQIRHRLWFNSNRRWLLRQLQITDNDADEVFRNFLQRFLFWIAPDLDDCLLSEIHPLIVEYYDDLENRPLKLLMEADASEDEDECADEDEDLGGVNDSGSASSASTPKWVALIFCRGHPLQTSNSNLCSCSTVAVIVGVVVV